MSRGEFVGVLAVGTAACLFACGGEGVPTDAGMGDATCVDGHPCVCEDGVCTEPIGGTHQRCYPDRTCDEGLRCASGRCIECIAGELGCACGDAMTCDMGLACLAGTCVDDVTLREVPDDPRCYSPCREGLTDGEGLYRACDVDGLMEGCLDGMECVDGSCVGDDGALPHCSADVDCASHQLCIQGQCYANCELDSDCRGAQRCHRHACRAVCNTSEGGCAEGGHCQLMDGEHGVCMPMAEAPKLVIDPVVGGYSLSRDTVTLSNRNHSATILLTNDTPRTLEFSLRRLADDPRPEAEEAEEAEEADEHRDIPMPWLLAGTADEPGKDWELSLGRVPGNGGTLEVKFEVEDDEDVPARWHGAFEIVSEALGARRVQLSYAATPDGRWAGKVYYFGQWGDRNLDAWMTDRGNDRKLAAVGNAFVQKLGNLRQGVISAAVFEAALRSTVTESWRWPSTRALCPGFECFPFVAPDADEDDEPWRRYTDDNVGEPIPGGVVELPIAVDLRMTGGVSLEGRIVSSHALQYPADPKLSLSFATDPLACDGSSSASEACLTYVASLDARLVVGGRYRTDREDVNCRRLRGPGTRLQGTPWLVPGFTAGAEPDPETGLLYTHECREDRQPYADQRARNAGLSAANPIPDGQRRIRTIDLVDGFLLNQETLYLVFRERSNAGFAGRGSDGFQAYGVMVLNRTLANLDDTAFEGTSVEDEAPEVDVDVMAAVACDADLASEVLGQRAPTSRDDWDWERLLNGLLDGSPPDPEAAPYAPEEVHYLCHDTGLFDAGPADAIPPARCPATSPVTYFAASAEVLPVDLSGHPCQSDGTCREALAALTAQVPGGVELDPVFRCSLGDEVICDRDRADLRAGKTFYPAAAGAPTLRPLQPEVDDAFRYKTHFRNRRGDSVGFVPEVCVDGSNLVPYCYDPAKIEAARARVDCLVDGFSQHYSDLSSATRGAVKAFLDLSFGYQRARSETERRPVRGDGFELLQAELLIMLGDEAYTRAFSSRFDLAGEGQASFEGSLFEPDGVDLAGVAGHELYTLYQATQYYRLVLERFHALSPAIWKALDHGADSARNFVSLETVVGYFRKVLRASTQKSRAWSEIGKRYQSMNRPRLARLVLERAYSSAYMESMVLTRAMQRVAEVVPTPEGFQIGSELDQGMRTYKIALLDMREVYSTFTDNMTYFGFEPGYIPMPALEPEDPDAFRTLLATAEQATAFAAEKEARAIEGARGFDTDTAEFQSELAKIRSTYEQQLGDLCGSFTADNGQVYPAIRKYAYLSADLAPTGDPCGLRNGELFDAVAGLELLGLEIDEVQRRYDSVAERLDAEDRRVEQRCGIARGLAKYRYERAEAVDGLQNQIAGTQAMVGVLQRNKAALAGALGLAKCSGLDCATSGPASASFVAYHVAVEGVTSGLEAALRSKRQEMAEIARDRILVEADYDCQLLQVESQPVMLQLGHELVQVELDALRTAYRIRLSGSGIERLRDEATRLMAEQADAEQLAINVEAARNDPNVRIYKNDAIINADEAFFRALQDAYRATKVYEYYTSQSYPRLDELTLVRLVAHGDHSLEGYLAELREAFYAFEERFGRPDIRVDVLSLKDDVLAVPLYDERGHALTQGERDRLFRETITDTGRLDARGYVVMPFSTALSRLSPLTRNHKLAWIEAELVGAGLGDTVARVYVTQSGTGTVAALDGEQRYFRFPERTAVVETFFNGTRVFTPEVYRNDRLRDLPYANTAWELILNQRDERVNQDVALNALSDIRLYFYYSDFTAL